MGAFGKAITALLGIIAVLACIATVAIVGYSLSGGANGQSNQVVTNTTDVSTVPSTAPDVVLNFGNDGEIVDNQLVDVSDVNIPTGEVPTAVYSNHVHNYQPVTIKKATCLESGQIQYICSCGDSYTVDQLATGHVPDDWEVVKAATENADGQKVRRCLYCNDIVASETIPATGSANGDGSKSVPKHEHLYVSTVERAPSCVLAGLRKHTCSCGDFYTESIPAIGHVATDWTETVAPTVTTLGSSTRTCSVCGAMLDIKSIPALTPGPSASGSAAPSGSAGASASAAASAAASQAPASTAQATSGAGTTPSTGASASASPGGHTHSYKMYVVTPATCTEKGIRSYVCGCGSSYAESIELDLNNHKYAATFVAPTDTQQGYTVYTCVRCNYNFKDNYIMPLTNKGNSSDAEASASASPEVPGTAAN